jgi:CBS domain-containing protein
MTTVPPHKTVADVMTSLVHVASPLAPFKLLVRLIEEHRVSAIPIVDASGVPVGIVSESDLLLKGRRLELESSRDFRHLPRGRQERAKAAGTIASDVMTAPVINIPTDTSLTDAARLMHEKNVRRLVVVDQRGRIAGIVSRSDLLQVFLRSDEDLRDEIVSKLIPANLPSDHSIAVEVHWNVATLSGEVDRKGDAELLVRLTSEIDGMVGVVDRLDYRWNDTVAAAVRPVSRDRTFKAI